MRRSIIFLVVATAVLGTSALAYGQVVQERDAAREAAVQKPEDLDVPTELEDWCFFMTDEFGPGRASPSVVSAVNDMIERKTTDYDNYLALLEGEPRDIAGTYAVVRAAATESLEGRELTKPDQALSAAGAIDEYLRANCESR